MKTLMVANNNGKMPKGFIKQLKSVSKLNWQYENVAKCFIAEIDDEKEAKFIAMKIIAISTGISPDYYCAYIEDRNTIFYHNRLEGYIPMKNEILNKHIIINTKDTKVREWYIKTYPDDELARSISEAITFGDVLEALERKKNVYKLFKVDDSMIREHIFAELATIMEVDYQHVYDLWMMCEEDMEFVITETIIYYTCPECQEEALRYAMIDIDGTNLEEGYSCSECKAIFIGTDNDIVIEINPEIIK